MEQAVVGVIRRGGRVLVIERGPGAALWGYWAPPSGRIESGESQAQAVVREMREELGPDVRPLAKVCESPTEDARFLLHWWTVEESGGSLNVDPREVSAVRWVDGLEFRELESTFAGDRVFFNLVLATLG